MATGWERAAGGLRRAQPGDELSLLVRTGPDANGAAAFERVDGEVVDRARYQGILELRVDGEEPYVVVRPAPTVPTVTVRRVGGDAWDGPWEQVGLAEALAVDGRPRTAAPDPAPGVDPAGDERSGVGESAD